MTEDEAREEIAIYTNADEFPKLSLEEIALLARKSRRVDKNGRLADDTNWVPTFDVAFGISEGWRLKAVKVATAYDISSSDQRLSRSQMYKNFMDQVKIWERKMGGVSEIQVVSQVKTSDVISTPVANWNDPYLDYP